MPTFGGVNALIYYSPSLFEGMGLDYSMQLHMSGVINIVEEKEGKVVVPRQ
jgi:hypothetical protein